MHDHVGETLDLNRIAKLSGLSRPHFNHLFRHCTGVSPRSMVMHFGLKPLSERYVSNSSTSLLFRTNSGSVPTAISHDFFSSTPAHPQTSSDG
jgi:AraC-like DNA-binding protein